MPAPRIPASDAFTTEEGFSNFIAKDYLHEIRQTLDEVKQAQAEISALPKTVHKDYLKDVNQTLEATAKALQTFINHEMGRQANPNYGTLQEQNAARMHGMQAVTDSLVEYEKEKHDIYHDSGRPMRVYDPKTFRRTKPNPTLPEILTSLDHTREFFDDKIIRMQQILEAAKTPRTSLQEDIIPETPRPASSARLDPTLLAFYDSVHKQFTYLKSKDPSEEAPYLSGTIKPLEQLINLIKKICYTDLNDEKQQATLKNQFNTMLKTYENMVTPHTMMRLNMHDPHAQSLIYGPLMRDIRSFSHRHELIRKLDSNNSEIPTTPQEIITPGPTAAPTEPTDELSLQHSEEEIEQGTLHIHTDEEEKGSLDIHTTPQGPNRPDTNIAASNAFGISALNEQNLQSTFISNIRAVYAAEDNQPNPRFKLAHNEPTKDIQYNNPLIGNRSIRVQRTQISEEGSHKEVQRNIKVISGGYSIKHNDKGSWSAIFADVAVAKAAQMTYQDKASFRLSAGTTAKGVDYVARMIAAAEVSGIKLSLPAAFESKEYRAGGTYTNSSTGKPWTCADQVRKLVKEFKTGLQPLPDVNNTRRLSAG